MQFKRLALCAMIVISLASSASAGTWSDFWCRNYGLGCPPPAQSIATTPDASGFSVPAAVTPNGQSLASYDQAAQIKAYLNAKFVAQIISGDDSVNPGHVAPDGSLGTYVPLFIGPGISAPSIVTKGVKYYYLHFRFDNGADINVGLAVQKFQSFPSNPDYVLRELARNAGTLTKADAAAGANQTAIITFEPWGYSASERAILREIEAQLYIDEIEAKRGHI